MVIFRQKLEDTRDFVIGAELVTTRGMLSAGKAARVQGFGLELAALPGVDWVSRLDDHRNQRPRRARHREATALVTLLHHERALFRRPERFHPTMHP